MANNLYTSTWACFILSNVNTGLFKFLYLILALISLILFIYYKDKK